MALDNDNLRYTDDEQEVRLLRKFVGVERVTPRNENHAAGFDAALTNALNAADRAVRDGMTQISGTFQVSVTFEAEVVVGSPGNVGEYKAIVTQI